VRHRDRGGRGADRSGAGRGGRGTHWWRGSVRCSSAGEARGGGGKGTRSVGTGLGERWGSSGWCEIGRSQNQVGGGRGVRVGGRAPCGWVGGRGGGGGGGMDPAGI
jgi:hypothetical protein